jgi:hypothetical protein
MYRLSYSRCVAEPLARLFVFKESIMNQIQKAVVQTFCTKLYGYIESGVVLRDAMLALMPVYNKADVEAQHEMRNMVVRVIGDIKKVKPIVLPKGKYAGALGFSKTTVKGNQARTMLQYYFPTGNATAISKQVDVVDSARKRAEKFAESHKKSEIQQRIAILNAELKALKAYV